MRTVAELRPPPAVFGFEHDHGVFTVHDDVTGANFLSYFHKWGCDLDKAAILAFGRDKAHQPLGEAGLACQCGL